MGRKINLPMEQIISEYESGMSTTELGKKYGASKPTINYRLRKAGVQLRNHRERAKATKKPLPVAQIRYEYLSGMTATELGVKYGVSPSTIIKRLREAGLRIRNRSEYNYNKINLPMEQIISEYGSGVGCFELGEKYRVSGETIAKRLREAGVQLRKPGNKVELPISEIWFDYESGMSIHKLGEKYRVHQCTIYRRLVKAGVQIHGNLLELPVEEIISDYQSGMTLAQLAERYGVLRKTIRKRLRDAGVQTRNHRERAIKIDLPVAQIKSEYQSGMTLVALGQKYGVAQSTIKRRLEEVEVQTSKNEHIEEF